MSIRSLDEFEPKNKLPIESSLSSAPKSAAANEDVPNIA